MKAMVWRVGAIVLVLALMLVPGVQATSDCADYISSGGGDEPLSGTLVGQQTRTLTTQQSFSGTYGTPVVRGTYTYNRSFSTTYNVGTYQMSDGSTITVRCDTYQRV